MHSLISQHLERMAPKRDDPLRSIILELGGGGGNGFSLLGSGIIDMGRRFFRVYTDGGGGGEGEGEGGAMWLGLMVAQVVFIVVQLHTNSCGRGMSTYGC